MVHHVVLFRFYPEIDDERVEWILRQTRIRLLKIGEVRAIRCGKRIESENDWGFFFGVDFESMDKMAQGHADANYERFLEEVIQPHVVDQLALSYEMEPGKDVRYS
jgi:hypothetical protein